MICGYRYRVLATLVCYIGAMLLAGCPGPSGAQPPLEQEATMPSTLQTDIAGLQNWIDPPATPVAARWLVRERGGSTAGIGPTDLELIAILEFSPAEVESLVGQMVRQTSPADLYVREDFFESWMPSELRSLFEPDPLYPGLLRLVTDRYQPDLLAPKAMKNGYALPFGNYMLIYLFDT